MFSKLTIFISSSDHLSVSKRDFSSNFAIRSCLSVAGHRVVEMVFTVGFAFAIVVAISKISLRLVKFIFGSMKFNKVTTNQMFIFCIF